MGALAEQFGRIAEGAKITPVVVKGRGLTIQGPIVERGDPEGEFARDEHLVEIDGIPQRAEIVDPVFHDILVLERGGVDRGIDDTGGTADAEEDGVRSALHVDAIHDITVPRNFRQEVIAGIVGTVQTAHAGVLVRPQEAAVLVELEAAAVAGEIAADATNFGVGGVNQQVSRVLGSGVLHELFRHHRNRRGDVLQIGADAGAGERVLGRIAFILVRRHHER